MGRGGGGDALIGGILVIVIFVFLRASGWRVVRLSKGVRYDKRVQ